MPISAYSPTRDLNANIPPGNIITKEFANQQIVNSIRQLMADLAGLGITPFVEGLLNDPDAAAALTTLGVSTYIQTLLDDADAIAARATLGTSNWERIGTPTVVGSAVASVDFTGLSAYRWLRLIIDAMPATDGVSAIIRTSTNNGGAFDAGLSDYNDALTSFRGGITSSQTINTTSFFISNATTIGNAGGRGYNAEVLFMNFNQALICRMQYLSGWLDTGGVSIGGNGSGYRQQATARDALRFLFTAGNVAAGSTFVLEGIRG